MKVKAKVTSQTNGYIVWSFVRKTYTWWSPKSSHSWFHEIRQIFTWNLADFVWNLVDFMWNPPGNLINQRIQQKLQFHGVQWEGYVSWFHMKSTRNPPDFMKSATKDQQLPGMVRSMFSVLLSTQSDIKDQRKNFAFTFAWCERSIRYKYISIQ